MPLKYDPNMSAADNMARGLFAIAESIDMLGDKLTNEPIDVVVRDCMGDTINDAIYAVAESIGKRAEP